MTEKTPETILVAPDTDAVKCDGGGGALGHPVVWYDLKDQESVTCLYCGARFVKSRKVASR
ncbi:MAG: zinc-finger domain-containing protein [Alphaproteobacteria bacterium]|nr:zinc-finger domain-containing protein [Alphaproteobacteria bacterium]